MMKKLCSVFLVICLLLLSACNSKSSSNSSSNSKGTSTPTPSHTKEAIKEDYTKVAALKDIYAKDFLIGTIFAETNLGNKDLDLMTQQFNVITPENIMKPEAMQETEGNFTYASADKMIDFAKEKGLKVVGHNLCWHQQIPSFMQNECDKATAEAQLKSHISNVANHYKGKVISWDVVNEAIEDSMVLPKDGDWTKCLRKSKWYRSIGPEYLAMAFRLAKKADPDCKLYYNDYNLETQDKADICYAMLKDLLDQGVPIDGVGLQGHFQTGTSTGGLEYAIEKFSSLGIEISVTELDVTYSKTVNGEMPMDGEIQQALTYAQIFKVLKRYSDKITRVTFWGSIDSQSWRSEMFPCLFDANYCAKEAYYAVADPDKYLSEHEDELGIGTTQEGTASYGTPAVDGVEDEIWDSTEVMNINQQILAWEGASGTVKALWDEKHLYIFAHVKDGELNATGAGAHEKDSVEIFVDQKNDKKGIYGEDDGQYRMNYKGQLTFGKVPTKEGVEAVAKEEPGGYLVEMVIPFNEEMKADTVIGFDAQINDAIKGTRLAIAKWCDITDNSYLSTENYGNLTLVK